MGAPATGEPPIDRALSPLLAAEVEEYRSWESLHRTLFLMAYQWLAVSDAKDLTQLDGSAFTGTFQQGLHAALESMKVAARYSKTLPADAMAELNEATAVLNEASGKTEPAIRKAVQKFRFLRDRVAWELGSQNEVVSYEVVGDDPESPGTIYTRTVGGEGRPDVDAVFSTLDTKELVDGGLDLERAFEALGVPFQRSDLSGANLGDVGKMPILAYLITLVVGAVTFYYLYHRALEGGKLADAVRAAINSDPTLSPDQRLDLLSKFNASDSFFGAIFGSAFSWKTVILSATVFGIAFFVLPKLLEQQFTHKRMMTHA